MEFCRDELSLELELLHAPLFVTIFLISVRETVQCNGSKEISDLLFNICVFVTQICLEEE